jgi:hypothetical protein
VIEFIIMSIPTLKDFNRDNIQVQFNKDTQNINVYNVSTTKTPLHVKTSNWTCPFGRDDRNQLIVIIPDDQYYNVVMLDTLGRDICKMFYEKCTGNPLAPGEDIPYKSLIHKDDGLDTLHLLLTEHTRVFDNNNTKLDTEHVNQFTSGQFTANFLLSLSCIKVYNGVFFWSISPAQIKIRKYCTLPEGCIIFEDELQLKQHLNERDTLQIKAKEQSEEPVVEFDPDVNELLE